MQALQPIDNSNVQTADTPLAIIHQISIQELNGPVSAPGNAPPSSHEPHQELLFPVTPKWVCEEIGLNWWTAVKLFEEGWLSFSPESTARLDAAQEDELRFVGSLAVAGCDRQMLTALLRGLPKPYAHHANRLYYDWARRNWRVLPDPEAHPESTFTEWLEKLVKKGDTDSLMGILELTHDALTRVRAHPPQDNLKE